MWNYVGLRCQKSYQESNGVQSYNIGGQFLSYNTRNNSIFELLFENEQYFSCFMVIKNFPYAFFFSNILIKSRPEFEWINWFFISQCIDSFLNVIETWKLVRFRHFVYSRNYKFISSSMFRKFQIYFHVNWIYF